MPDIPTTAEAGFPTLVADNSYALFAPAGTPSPILARLHDAKAFLWPVYAALQEGQDAALRSRLMPGVTAALRALP